MGSKSISRCKCCGDYYCVNCSDADEYYNYCSKACEKEDAISEEND